MSEESNVPCRGTHDERVKRLLADFGCRLVELEDIVQAIHQQRHRQRWTWKEKWIAEEGPKYVNDLHTVVFEFPSGDVPGPKCLEFAQLVWMLQPSVFEYQTWSGRSFVRIWWDPDRMLRKRSK